MIPKSEYDPADIMKWISDKLNVSSEMGFYIYEELDHRFKLRDNSNSMDDLEKLYKLAIVLSGDTARVIDGKYDDDIEVISEPQFDHDCKACVFLGRVRYDHKKYSSYDFDLYMCPGRDKMNSFVARDADEGWRYISGSSYSHSIKWDVHKGYEDYPINLCKILAIEKGLLKESKDDEGNPLRMV